MLSGYHPYLHIAILEKSYIIRVPAVLRQVLRRKPGGDAAVNIMELSGDELRVYNVLQKNPPETKKALEAKLGWTPSTTNRAIQSLLQKGAILETGLKESSGGRRPSVFDIQAGAGFLLGIHISYGFVSLVLCDLKLQVLEQETLLLPPARDVPDTVLQSIAETFRSFLTRRSIPKEAVLGAGLGMFGPVNRETGITGLLMDYDQPIAPWSGIPICSMLEEALDLPVSADSACNTAALAEYCYGAGRGSRNTSFFLCDIGFTVGQISSGRILRHWDDRDDGFAHNSVDLNGELCRCGKRGCVHLYASVRAINRRIRQQVMAGASTRIPVPMEQVNFGHILQAAGQNDRTVVAALEEAGSYFGSALSDYLNLLSPDLVVLGGTMADENAFFYDSVLNYLARCHGEALFRRVRFLRSGSFGRMTAAVGAAALVYEKHVGNPILD